MTLLKQFPAGSRDLTLISSLLAAIKAAGNRVILLFCGSTTDTATVLQQAAAQGMTGAGYVWILPDGGAQKVDGYGSVGDFTGVIGILPATPSGPKIDAWNSRWASTYNQVSIWAYRLDFFDRNISVLFCLSFFSPAHSLYLGVVCSPHTCKPRNTRRTLWCRANRPLCSRRHILPSIRRATTRLCRMCMTL
jgi:hypothetical protein